MKAFGRMAAGREPREEKPGAGCWGQPRPGEERTGWASPPSPCGRPCRAGRPTKEAGARLTAVGLSVQPERSGGKIKDDAGGHRQVATKMGRRVDGRCCGEADCCVKERANKRSSAVSDGHGSRPNGGVPELQDL